MHIRYFEIITFGRRVITANLATSAVVEISCMWKVGRPIEVQILFSMFKFTTSLQTHKTNFVSIKPVLYHQETIRVAAAAAEAAAMGAAKGAAAAAAAAAAAVAGAVVAAAAAGATLAVAAVGAAAAAAAAAVGTAAAG